MSDSDEAMMLFGEEIETEEIPATTASPMRSEEIPIFVTNRFPSLSAESSRIIKFPPSALSVDFDETASVSNRSANVIQRRTAEDGSVESNARLIEWEDGSWTLAVGNEHFRVFERKEEVHLFDNQENIYVSVGQVHTQFNVIPGSLESRTHRHVVEQSAVSRKLNESRKVTLAHGLASATGTMSTIAVNMDAMPVAKPADQRRARASGQSLTADFLEEGFGSVRDIKNRFKKGQQPSKRTRRDESEDEDEYEQEDVDFLDDEDASGSSSGTGSSASSGPLDDQSSSGSSSSDRDSESSSE